MLTARGHVFLDGLQFTTDPAEYERQWTPRRTVLPTIGGSVVQDFGRPALDLRIRLTSGQTQLMSATLKAQLETRASQKGVVFTFTDWIGTEAQVPSSTSASARPSCLMRRTACPRRSSPTTSSWPSSR